MNITLRLLLGLALLAAPYFAHAQVGIWLPCRETSAYSEGRTVYIARYMQINTVGMLVDDLEDRYCVTPEKCVALGYCKAASPAEQAAADKAHPGAAAERARLEREQRQREAQAELQRKAAEAERNRKAAEVARETQRLGSHREAEARRLVEMREKAEQARGTKCQGTKPVKVAGHSDPDAMATSTALFPGWSTRDKALASARRGLGPNCRNLTGEAGIAAAKESCVQDSFKKWTCTVDATCMKQVPKCPAGAQ